MIFFDIKIHDTFSNQARILAVYPNLNQFEAYVLVSIADVKIYIASPVVNLWSRDGWLCDIGKDGPSRDQQREMRYKSWHQRCLPNHKSFELIQIGINRYYPGLKMCHESLYQRKSALVDQSGNIICYSQTGVKQGCALSTILFCLGLQVILKF